MSSLINILPPNRGSVRAATIKIIRAVLLLATGVVLTQNLQIFPGAVMSLFNNKARRDTALPPGIEGIFVETPDAKKLEIWRMAGSSSKVAIFFHGNGGDIETFLPYQLWLNKSLGYTTYSFDYRGYGRSTGWPSERGLEIDSDTVWSYIQQREKVSPTEIVLVGLSLGSAPATYLASKINPKVLVLLAPFPDLRSVVERKAVLNLLAPFLWYDFPTGVRLKELQETTLICVHGTIDEVIKYELGEITFSAFNGRGRFIKMEGLHHNNLLERYQEISAAIVEFMGS